MITAILTLGALWVLLGAVWLAVHPFLRETAEKIDEAEVERRELLAEKERLLGEIHELELDWETGKLSEEDYRELQARLKSRAVEVMREIDERETAGLERRSREAKREMRKPEVEAR